MNLHQRSTLLQISDLKKPKPPTKAAIKKAQFVDKTYVWLSK